MDDRELQSDFCFSEEVADNFNPLEDLDFGPEDDIDEDGYVPGVLDEGPYSMPDAQNAPKFPLVAFDNAENAVDRINTLFDQMPTLDRMLIEILEMALTPVKSTELDQRVAEIQKSHHSIYAPLTMCNLLERAGAIEQCDADGVSLATFEQEPLKVEVDGVEYWQVAPAPEVYWTTTPEGRERYEAYKPAELIKEVFEAEPHYRRFFLTTMNMCAQPGGASMKEIDSLISDAPELQKPRRYAMYFIDKLEKAGALKWGDTWAITEPGLEFLTAQQTTQDAAESEE